MLHYNSERGQALLAVALAFFFFLILAIIWMKYFAPAWNKCPVIAC